MAATFTITQTPSSEDLYLYPTGDLKTDLTPIGETNHYECVDDTRNNYDTSTYVYTDGISIVTDLFSMQDHTTETGTINSITVYARAKSNTYPQDSSGTFDILIGNELSTVTCHSSEATNRKDIILSTNYSNNYCVWNSNPTDSTTWSWDDVDNLIIGVECSSPTIQSLPVTEILRPTGDDGTNDWYPHPGDGVHYTKVYEESADARDTYLDLLGWTTGIWKYEYFTLGNHTTDSTGNITSVDLHFVALSWANSGAKIQPLIKLGGTDYMGTTKTLPGAHNWTNYSDTWSSNPTDSTTWDWDDINNIVIGAKGIKYTDEDPNLTQMYVVVNYTNDVNPEIRTTQCYAKIDYTPSTSTYYLNKPSSYTVSHNREVKKLNFWDGNRKTYDLIRSSKTLSMTGIEYDTGSSEATDRLNNIDTAKDNGAEITISGMTDEIVNDTWLITSFNYNQSAVNPNIYEWNMECEHII